MPLRQDAAVPDPRVPGFDAGRFAPGSSPLTRRPLGRPVAIGTLTQGRPLRYSINVTLDGSCDHRAIIPNEDLHRHAVENLNRADALLFGRVTYEMMEAAFRSPARTGEA